VLSRATRRGRKMIDQAWKDTILQRITLIEKKAELRLGIDVV